MGGSTATITDVSLRIPELAQVLDVLFLRAGFNSALVIIGSTLLGIAAGVVGSFAVLRKRALIGDALAHCALPGLALAFILAVWAGREEKGLLVLLSGAAASGVLGVVTIQLLTRYTRLSEDSAIGAVLSVFFGAGIVLLSAIQSMETGSAGGLSRFIYGQTAAMRIHDAYIMAGAALAVIVAAVLLLKEFSLVCFDERFAVVQGWPVAKIDLMMMTLVTLVTVIGLQSVGLILVVALLIVPAAAARFWTERLSRMVAAGALIGGLSGYLGSAASALFPRLPAGSVIVLAAGVIFCLSFLFAPRRGVVAGFLRLLRLRFSVFNDHLLRDIYETCERRGLAFDSSVRLDALPLLRGIDLLHRAAYLRVLSARGIIVLTGGALALTAKGVEKAKRLTRNHRLWEQYVFEYAHVSTSHVDYSADFVEHVLSPDIVKELEAGLDASRRGASASLHPLGEERK